MPEAVRWAGYALQALAWMLVAGSFVRPSPASLGAPAADSSKELGGALVSRAPGLRGIPGIRGIRDIT